MLDLREKERDMRMLAAVGLTTVGGCWPAPDGWMGSRGEVPAAVKERVGWVGTSNESETGEVANSKEKTPLWGPVLEVELVDRAVVEDALERERSLVGERGCSDETDPRSE